jgi:hypothetical protein
MGGSGNEAVKQWVVDGIRIEQSATALLLPAAVYNIFFLF